jgi:hypothetical protein
VLIWGWWTRGAEGEAVQPDQGPEWVWQARGRRLRTFPPRIRDEYWVEYGHNETDNPATDTRDLP